jgi:DNA-binding transcriptional LysR family regulator
VQVQVGDAPHDALLLALARGQVDLALVRALPQVPQGWRSVRLLDDEMVVFAGVRHPLARRRKLTLHDLRDQLWLPGHAVAATRTQLDAFARELGQPLRTCEVLTQLSDAICIFLRRTEAITLAPRGALWHFVQSGELAVLPLDRRIPFSSIGMLLPDGPLPPATQRLADFLLRHHQGDAAGAGPQAGP